MPVQFHNFAYSFSGPKGKPVFVPTPEGREIGHKVKTLVEENYEFDAFYTHFRPGGHVRALHAHRQHAVFAKLDLKDFFYTIGRNRVDKALKACGVRHHAHFAKWSTVKSPSGEGGYVLPYGFVQSPILASLVLSQSAVGRFLAEASQQVLVTVYLDDIAFSADDAGLVSEVFAAALSVVDEAGFMLNTAKVAAPSEAIEVFNCGLKVGQTSVLEVRRDAFYAEARSEESADAFERYCEVVEAGNTR